LLAVCTGCPLHTYAARRTGRRLRRHWQALAGSGRLWQAECSTVQAVLGNYKQRWEVQQAKGDKGAGQVYHVPGVSRCTQVYQTRQGAGKYSNKGRDHSRHSRYTIADNRRQTMQGSKEKQRKHRGEAWRLELSL